MKLQILQDNLKSGLFVVSHTASKNVNLPILHNVLIEAKDGNIKLSATNLEIGITCLLRGKVEVEGSYTVDAKIFYDFVSYLPNKKIDIEQKDDYVEIVTEQQQTKINGQSVDEYPVIPSFDKKIGFSVDLQNFKESLAQVVFAVSSSDTRLELTGVLFILDGNNVTLVATDSYRLSEKKLDVNNLTNESVQVIIPAKTIQEVLRVISGLKSTLAELEVYISENQVLFTYDSVEIISRVIDGQYPDYKQIIPNQVKTRAQIDSSQLIKAVKSASLFSKSGINDVNMDFPKDQNSLIISAVSGQTGENITKLEAKIEGDDNGVVVNYKYLIDGLNSVGGMVDINVVDGNTPVVFKSVDDDCYLYLVMPIKQ